MRNDGARTSIRPMNIGSVPDRAWAILFARLVLGLIFGMAGWGKIFQMGVVEHAHRYFVDPYAPTWIPSWLLWTLGLSIPFVESRRGGFWFWGCSSAPRFSRWARSSPSSRTAISSKTSYTNFTPT